MPNYIITEPMPSTPTYMRSGRGGAGNTFRVPSTSKKPVAARIVDPPLPPAAAAAASGETTGASTPSPASTQPRRYHSGIGGAGNVHMATERPVLSLEERFRRAAARDKATVGRCGIGGAGNVFRKKQQQQQQHQQQRASAASVAHDAASDAASVNSRTTLWRRVSSSFSRD